MKVRIDFRLKPWLCAGLTDYRPILHNVFLDPSGVLVATDTVMMAVCGCEIEEAPEGFEGLLLPAKPLAELAKKAVRNGWALELLIDLEAKTMMVATKTGNSSMTFDAEGTFPSWKRVSRPSLAAAGAAAEETRAGWSMFNPKALATCAEAIGRDKDGPLTPVYISGNADYIVLLGKDGASFGVVAPASIAAQGSENITQKAQALRDRFFPEAQSKKAPVEEQSE